MKHFHVRLILLPLICFVGFSCQGENQSPLYRIYKDGKYGYIDSTGNEVIKPQYLYGDIFQNGLALVVVDTSIILNPVDYSGGKTPLDSLRKRGFDHSDTLIVWKYGYINQDGDIAIDTTLKIQLPFKAEQYTDFYQFGRVNFHLLLRLSNGLIPYSDIETGKWGYLSAKGEVKIEPQYVSAWNFSEGLASVEVKDINQRKTQWGYIDTTGTVVIPCKYSGGRSFSDGLALVSMAETGTTDYGKYGKGYGITIQVFYINKEGLLEIGPWEGMSRKFYDFTDGMAIVEQRIITGYQFLDKKGQFNYNEPLIDVTYYSEGYAGVKLNNDKWIYVTKKLDIPCENLFDGVFPFKEGYAAVKNDGEWGFVDTTFQVKIPYKFDAVTSFNNGLARFSIKRPSLTIEGYINKQGQIVWQTEHKQYGINF